MFASKVRWGSVEVKAGSDYLIMQQPFTSGSRSPFPYLNPVVQVTVAGREIGANVSRFGVVSDLREKADTCVVMVADQNRSLAESIKRGDLLAIGWGYAGEELTEIFRGVVREVGSAGQTVIRGIDWNVLLNSLRANATFQDDTISGIVKAIIADASLKVEIEECDVTPELFPGFGRTIRECLDELSQLAGREKGEEYFDYIRDGVFHWGQKKKDAAAVRSFQTGVDIIRTEPSGGGLLFLETMVTGIQHSQVIEVDGERRYVLRSEYLWDSGGRTRIWSELAG